MRLRLKKNDGNFRYCHRRCCFGNFSGIDGVIVFQWWCCHLFFQPRRELSLRELFIFPSDWYATPRRRPLLCLRLKVNDGPLALPSLRRLHRNRQCHCFSMMISLLPPLSWFILPRLVGVSWSPSHQPLPRPINLVCSDSQRCWIQSIDLSNIQETPSGCDSCN